VGDTAFVELGVGQSVEYGGIAVRFDAVTGDSRCPSGVQCVWAGDAGIQLTLVAGGESEVVELHTTLDPRDASFGGFAIGFRDLRPYPAEGVPGDPDGYVATLTLRATHQAMTNTATPASIIPEPIFWSRQYTFAISTAPQAGPSTGGTYPVTSRKPVQARSTTAPPDRRSSRPARSSRRPMRGTDFTEGAMPVVEGALDIPEYVGARAVEGILLTTVARLHITRTVWRSDAVRRR
jgi:hypothetical protein